MKSNRKNHKSADACHSAASARSSALDGSRVSQSHGNASSVASPSVGSIVPKGQHSPFIIQNLKKVRSTKSGKLSLDVGVGTRIAAIQRHESKLREMSGCAFYFDVNIDASKSHITIVAVYV